MAYLELWENSGSYFSSILARVRVWIRVVRLFSLVFLCGFLPRKCTSSQCGSWRSSRWDIFNPMGCGKNHWGGRCGDTTRKSLMTCMERDFLHQFINFLSWIISRTLHGCHNTMTALNMPFGRGDERHRNIKDGVVFVKIADNFLIECHHRFCAK